MLRRIVLSAILVLPTVVACSAPSDPTATVPIPSVSPTAEPDPPATAQPTSKPAATRPAAPAPDRIGGGCEAAKAAYLQRCQDQPADCGGKAAEAITAGAYGAVLNHGRYLAACGAPLTMEVTVCAAVKDGRAEAVTVTTVPHDSGVGRCVAAAVSGLSFPSSPRLDITRTTFAAQ